ncbi:MipA/OmpV family protein [Aureimonas mangrovi]|uniref:MipA/OmpV family protein n=1 Tax=Aureimonas mangrovi TaxID=2758041 RepID=UPI00163DB991|nr:MipA/OmpV family protein [Aureimonas mangrovi]
MPSNLRHNRRAALVLACAAAGLTATAHTVSAADIAEPAHAFEPFETPQEPFRNWTLIIGAGATYEPEYEGGEDFEVSPVPVFLFTYSDWLEVDPTGVALRVFAHEGFSVSGLVGYETGRDEDDADRLEGLGDIDFTATVGGRLAYERGPFELYAAAEQTIDGSESLIGTAGLSLTAPVSERLILGANVEAVVADDNHMEAYFGVDAIQSAASGLPEYTAEAGLKRVDLSASATYFVTEKWLLRGEAGVGFLTGDAADSPIVEEELQPAASLFVGYRF